jgi:hypothetical protein
MKDMKPVKNIDTLTPSAEGKLDIAISFARDSVAFAGTLNHIYKYIPSFIYFVKMDFSEQYHHLRLKS